MQRKSNLSLRQPLLGFVTALMLAFVPEAVAQGTCGIAPVAPIPPIGCQSMRPMCLCAAGGASCQWQFICIPEKENPYSVHETRYNDENSARRGTH